VLPVSPALRRGLIAFIAVMVVLVGAIAYSEFFVPSNSTERADVPIGGPFTLTDQNGTVRHDSDFRGKLMLVYFGYTYCPDVCPTTLSMMTEALTKLGPKARDVQPIFITVDPRRDDVAQMKLYAANFDPDLEALTGTPDQIAAVAREYRVYFEESKSADGGSYTVDHSSIVYLMGRDGRYVGHFDPDITANGMADALKKYL
jgi:protein SCO1